MRTLLACALAVAAWPGTVAACSCMAPGPPVQEAARAEAVFVGIVRGQDGPYPIPTGDGTSYRESSVHFRLEVLAAWKGVTARRLVVVTGSGGGDCGYRFAVGEAYIVYAYAGRVARRDTVHTGICSRTAPLSRAGEDLAQLGSPSLDVREGRTWESFRVPERCPRHGLPIRSAMAHLVFDLPPESATRLEEAAPDSFPFHGLQIDSPREDPGAARFRSTGAAWVCPLCREAAVEWTGRNGARCPFEDVAPGVRPGGSGRGDVADEEYRRLHPRGNFAFLLDDGHRLSYDSIERRLDRRFGTLPDTTIELALPESTMASLYDRMIENRIFDVDAPHPPYPAAYPGAEALPCRAVRFFVRSDTLVREFRWNTRQAPDPPLPAERAWSRLTEAFRAVRDALLHHPALLALPPLPR